jgi:polysaccharide export outer membrane protein
MNIMMSDALTVNRLRGERGVRLPMRAGRLRRAARAAAWLAGGALALALPTMALASAEPQAKAIESSSTQVPAPAAAAAAGQTTSEYIIGPGDTIQVFVWRSPELSVTVPVRPDGKISTPLVEDVVAVGKTPAQLAREMESVLSAYIRTPQVNIIVTNALSAFSHITVIGQVAKPQTVAYKEGMTVMDVLLAVGGLTDFAAGNRAKLIRKDPNGKEIEIKLHLQDLLRKGRMKENLGVRPGDVLVVPETLF